MCLTECELEVYNKKIKMSQEISKICKKLKFVGKMGREGGGAIILMYRVLN